MLIASALGNLQVAFVVGHELGHVALDHFGGRAVPPRLRADDFDAETYSFREHHDQEFAADREGARMVIEHFKRIYDPLFGPNEPSCSQAGVDIFFSYIDLLFSGESKTHPAPSMRKAKLREYLWPKIPDTSRQLAEAAELIVESFRAAA